MQSVIKWNIHVEELTQFVFLFNTVCSVDDTASQVTWMLLSEI